MIAEPNIAEIAALMGERSRAAMLVALLGKEALPATELASQAYISPQTASSHLSKLVAGNLLTVEQHGRHRYYRLASDAVGRAIESLAIIAPAPRAAHNTQEDERLKTVRYARTCYDHMAGKVAIAIAGALEQREFLMKSGRAYEVTESGKEWFRNLRIDTDNLRASRRTFALQCLDWTERQYHISGALGAALLDRLLSLKYIARARTPRCIRVTVEGKRALNRLLNLNL
ncbi:MAG TPA: helix-turn-helix domain-containing protein [Pyrinomonadaceae bacterium]